MPEEFFYGVIAPTFVRGCPVICISTLNMDEGNYFSRILNKRRKDGRPIFRNIVVRLACDECVKKNIARRCEHMMGRIPRWHSRRSHRMLHDMLPPQVFARETRNILTSTNISKVFTEEDIEHLRTKASDLPSIGDATELFVGIDPACGGSQSTYAGIAFVVINGKFVVRMALQRSLAFVANATSSMFSFIRAFSHVTDNHLKKVAVRVSCISFASLSQWARIGDRFRYSRRNMRFVFSVPSLSMRSRCFLTSPVISFRPCSTCSLGNCSSTIFAKTSTSSSRRAPVHVITSLILL